MPGPAASGYVLPPEVVRTMVWSRLRTLASDLKGPSADVWRTFARQWNRGYTPVVPWPPGQGMMPLGHAARSCAGNGLAWQRIPGGWKQSPADQVLRELRVDPVPWDSGFVQDFVRGEEAELACALHQQLRLRSLIDTTLGCAVRLRPLVVWGQALDPQGMSAEVRLREPYVLWAAQRQLFALRDEVIRQGDLLVCEAESRTARRVQAVVRASEDQVRGARILAFFAHQQLGLTLRGRGSARAAAGGDVVIGAAAARLAAVRSPGQGVACGVDAIAHVVAALDHAHWITSALCTALAGGTAPARGGQARQDTARRYGPS
ncbi:aromatic amino acid lyase [Streptomyces sp. NPDC058877]|uniref:aromatic amino acid lyase n=1 Tax=Streptomyces sp. NPDC058877 TaxID=3346665 RepID=UPI0036B583A2